jgi:hypothetical protein
VEKTSAAYPSAAAARARKLGAEITTRWVKEHLEAEIAWHDQNETPGYFSGASPIPLGDDRTSGLSAGDYSIQRLRVSIPRVVG